MIDVSILARLVPETTLLKVLAIKEDVALKVLLKVEKVRLVSHTSFEVVVD